MSEENYSSLDFEDYVLERGMISRSELEAQINLYIAGKITTGEIWKYLKKAAMSNNVHIILDLGHLMLSGFWRIHCILKEKGMSQKKFNDVVFYHIMRTWKDIFYLHMTYEKYVRHFLRLGRNGAEEMLSHELFSRITENWMFESKISHREPGFYSRYMIFVGRYHEKRLFLKDHINYHYSLTFLERLRGGICIYKEGVILEVKKALEFFTYNITQADEYEISLKENKFSSHSFGGIAASSEQHGLSLLSAHVSTFDVIASLFFSPAITLRRRGGNNGLATV